MKKAFVTVLIVLGVILLGVFVAAHLFDFSDVIKKMHGR